MCGGGSCWIIVILDDEYARELLGFMEIRFVGENEG